MDLASLFAQRLRDNASLQIEGLTIICRASDGYINATQLCKAGGKLYGTWRDNDKAEKFITALSSSIGAPVNKLIKKEFAGPNETRGTWVHPRVAINIAQWISPKFDVLVGNWIDSLRYTVNVQSTYIDYLLHRLESIEHQSELHSQISQLNKELEDTRCKLIELEKRQGILLQGDIYTVKCKTCDCLYIGSANDAHQRFKEHLNNFSVKDSFANHMKEHGRQSMELIDIVKYTVKDRDELYLHEEKAIIKAREIHGIDKVMNKVLPKRKCNNNRNI